MNPVDLMVMSLANDPDDLVVAELLATNLAKLGPISQPIADRLVKAFRCEAISRFHIDRVHRIAKAARVLMRVLIEELPNEARALFNREVWSAFDALEFVLDAECPET